MKIEKVHIKNVKGIKDLELSFKKDNEILDVIVLAGINGSGKTTILEAIKDFFDIFFDNKNNNDNDSEKSNINLEIFFEEFEKYSSYNLKRVKFLNTFHYEKSDHNTSSQNQTINNFESLAKIIYVPAENNFEKVKTDTTTLLRISQFINIINSNVIKDIPSYIATRRNYLATIEEDLTMKEVTNKVLNEINGIFNIL